MTSVILLELHSSVLIHFQNTTTMLLQGERMNVSLGGYSIPVASLNAFTMASIALLIPILDLFIYPMLNRFNKGPTMLQRMGERAASLISFGCLLLVETI